MNKLFEDAILSMALGLRQTKKITYVVYLAF